MDGHCRYAHVGALRGDGVTPSILGMNKIIGDNSLRRALVYNGWSWYVRLAHPKTRLTITPEAATQIKALVANVCYGLQLIAATAPQVATRNPLW